MLRPKEWKELEEFQTSINARKCMLNLNFLEHIKFLVFVIVTKILEAAHMLPSIHKPDNSTHRCTKIRLRIFKRPTHF